MANTAEQAIYNRLASAQTFHPVNAELLPDDWTLEPGDIVTITSGEESFPTPVYHMDLRWTGGSQVTIASTGNEKRDPLPKLRRKEYATNSAIYSGSRSMAKQQEEMDGYYQNFIEQKGLIGMIAGSTGIVLDADGKPVVGPDGKFVYDPNSKADVFSQLLMEPNLARLISAINESPDNAISYSKIDLDASGNILIEAINKRTDSTANINADKIYLNGHTLVDELTALSASIKNLTVGNEKASVLRTSFLNSDNTKSALLNVTEDFVFRDERVGKYNVSMTGIAASGRYLGMSGVNLAHSHSVAMEEITSGDNAGKVKVALGGAVETTSNDRIDFFDIAASQTYLDGVAAARNISSISGISISTSDFGSTVSETVTVTNGDGSTRSANVSVTVPAAPSASVTADDIDIANAGEIQGYNSDPGSGYTNLGSLGAAIRTLLNISSTGKYMTFRGTIDGVPNAGYKYYKIPL